MNQYRKGTKCLSNAFFITSFKQYFQAQKHFIVKRN